MKNWKRIIYRAVAVLLAVAVFAVRLPDLRMKAYAVDPFTAMAGEEVVSYVISAIAAACGVNISSGSSDVVADVRFWVSQAKDDYEIRARVADREVVKTVAAVSFVRAQEYFQSLADKTFTLVGNGLAVPRDVMDVMSAYFNAKTAAYTPEFSSSVPFSTYRAVYRDSYFTEYRTSDDYSSTYNSLSIPNGFIFIRASNHMCFYNATSSDLSFVVHYVRYLNGVLKDDVAQPYTVAPGEYYPYYAGQLAEYSNLLNSVQYGCKSNSTSDMKIFLKANIEQMYGSVIDNDVLVDAIPSDNWQWSQVENAQTGTAEDVVILQPDAAPTEEELNQRLADALVAGLLGDLLEQLGIMAKEAEQPPEPSSSEEESSEPAIVPTDPPVPSESPSESLDPEPGGDPDPGVDPDPDVKPDLSLSQAVQAVEGFFQGISAKLDLLLNPFTQENMEKRTLKGVVMTRFPFCIPFDLIDCVKIFEVSAVEPRWEIPLNVPSIGFHYVFVLDLTQFGDLVKLLRVSILLFYIGALILATRSLIKG